MMGHEEESDLPLTAGQLQHLQVVRSDPARRMAIWKCFRISGELDIERLTDSIQTLVLRHDALRIEIVERPFEGPRQRIRSMPPRESLVFCQNVLARSEEQFSRYVRHILAQEQRAEWHTDAHPFRFRLFRYSPTVHALMVGLSHIAVDGIGAEILVRDLVRIYADALAGRAPRGLARPGFADSVIRRSARGGDRSGHSGERARSALPERVRFDVPPPESGEPGGRSRQLSLSFAGAELAALREQAGLHGCTEFTWLLAAFAGTVFGYTVQDRIAISVPIDLRSAAEREVVGMYVLAVPLVIERPREADGWRGFVAGVGSALLRTMVRCRRDGGPDGGYRTDVSINYRKMDGLSNSRFYQMAGTDYLPRADYWTMGIDLGILSYPDVLDAHVVLDSSVFSEDTAKSVSETLIRNLTTGPAR